MVEISRKWFGEENEDKCQSKESEITSARLNVDSFKGLFVIAGVSSSSALAIFLLTFLYDHRYILTSTASLKHKIYQLAKNFSREKENEPSKASSTANGGGGGGSISCDHQEMFSQDEEITPPPPHHVTQP